jgi:hypothetical protein
MTAQKRNSTVVSVPAPIMGWNVRDPLPMMPPNYAPILDNVFCLPSELQMRKGYTQQCTFTGTAKTLLEYSPVSGNAELFAAVDNAGACSIYTVDTTETTIPFVATTVVTGLTSAEFKQTHCSTSGGEFAYYVNAANDALLYNGTTFQAVNSTSTPYAITGPSNTHFSDVIVHKRRLWFVEKDSMSCWYLPTDQIAGAAVKFDFAPIFTRGGKISKIDTWSLDAGTGLDDFFIVFSSQGEVAVYQGTDPASYTTWSLKGVFYIGSPTGTGFTCKYGGDLLIVNKDGIAQMSKSLMSSRVNTQLQMTDKIQPRLASDTSDYATNQGWDLLLYPPQNMLIVNIPVSDTSSYQYVMNTISGAWARWTGIPAKCFYFHKENIYFGANGYVGLAWNTQADNGTEIVADILPAYQNFGAQSRLKRWSMARVVLSTSTFLEFGTRMEVDFNINPQTIDFPFIVETLTATYGRGRYGTNVYSNGAASIRAEWKNTTGMGYWGSLHIQFRSKVADVRLYSIDLITEAGGNI